MFVKSSSSLVVFKLNHVYFKFYYFNGNSMCGVLFLLLVMEIFIFQGVSLQGRDTAVQGTVVWFVSKYVWIMLERVFQSDRIEEYYIINVPF